MEAIRLSDAQLDDIRAMQGETLALLRALSPYLSPERQNALDTVIKVSTLVDLLSEVM